MNPMERLTEQFYINRKALEIYSQTIWSRKFIKYLTEIEVEEIILREKPEVFINSERDLLEQVSLDEVNSIWKEKLQNHIVNDPEDFNQSDYENGYCYVSQLWKAKGGKKILVFFYHH